MAAAYDIDDKDLVTPRDREVIRSTENAPVGFITVILLPTGADVDLHIGAGGKPWPLKNQGQYFRVCPPVRTGLYLTNPVGGGTLVLGISFDDGPQGGR